MRNYLRIIITLLAVLSAFAAQAQHSGLQYTSERDKVVRIPTGHRIILPDAQGHDIRRRLVMVSDSGITVSHLGRPDEQFTYSLTQLSGIRKPRPGRNAIGVSLLGAAGVGLLSGVLNAGLGGVQRNTRLWFGGATVSFIGSITLFATAGNNRMKPHTLASPYDDPLQPVVVKDHFVFRKPKNYIFADVGTLRIGGLFYERQQPVGEKIYLLARAGIGIGNNVIPILGVGATLKYRIAPDLVLNALFFNQQVQRYYHDTGTVHAALSAGVLAHITNHFFVRPNVFAYPRWTLGGPEFGFGVSAGGCF